MTDPGGSDRIQQDVPTASATGDNSDTTPEDIDDVPLTAEEAIERDRATDDQPARTPTRPQIADDPS
jgi:hypothetical protein